MANFAWMIGVVMISYPVASRGYRQIAPRFSCQNEPTSSCNAKRYGMYDETANCQCDNACNIYKDCCFDAEYFNTEPDISPNIAVSCHNLVHYSREPIYMVTSCPHAFDNNETRANCEIAEKFFDIRQQNPILHIPVSDKKNGLVYKNVYCAACNGIKYTEFSYWQLSVECGDLLAYHMDMSSDVMSTLNTCSLSGHIYNLNLPENVTETRRCYYDIKSCPSDFDDNQIRTLCMNHTDYRFDQIKTRFYKNRFCAKCNGMNADYLMCDVSMSMERYLPSSMGRNSIGHSFKILLDFNTGNRDIMNNFKNSDVKSQLNTSCGMGYKFDPYSEKCRFLFCPAGYRFESSESKCYLKPYSQTGLDFQNQNNQTCPLVSLNVSSELTFLNNNAIFIPKAEVTLNSSDYILSDDGSSVFICSSILDRMEKTRWRNVDNEIQSIISMVGLVLSVVALGTLIIIYGTFKSLQNGPGKCLLALSSSLLLGQLLFLLSSLAVSNKITCLMCGVLMHFSFLSAFFWMNVLAFNIWRTFNQQYKPARQSQGNSRFIRQSLYAFGLPFVIASTCLATSLLLESDSMFNARYGVEICWIGNKYVLLAAFGAPLAGIIILNSVFFSMAVYHIHQAAAQSAKVVRPGSTSEGSSKLLLLYVKLSTIMGLTWLFGFVANFVFGSTVFWYLFIICNTLQGVFIALGFLCNKKVFRLIKKSVQRYRGDTSESDTLYSRRTTRTQSSII